MVVLVADAEVDEDAVVVGLGDAALADAAVLGAGGLEQLARLAVPARVEEGVVVGVQRHVVGVRLGCDEAWVRCAAEVEKEVRQNNGDNGGEFGEPANVGPGCRQVEIFTYGEYGEEKYLSPIVSVEYIWSRDAVLDSLTTTVGCLS